MNYVWTFCPKCEGQMTLQFARNDAGLSGSLRRWSRDRSVNDGRLLQVAAGEVAPDGAFEFTCLCGQSIPVAASEIQQATTERPAV
jgi:coproporphyrinogen III oxidase